MLFEAKAKARLDHLCEPGCRLRGVEPDLKAQLVKPLEDLLVKQTVAPGFA